MPVIDTFAGEPKNTREAILQATHEVLCEQGYGGVSMSRIAERVDISKSVLYHHYDDKDDLLRELLDATLSVLLEASFRNVEEEPVAALRRFLSIPLSDPLPGDVEGADPGITADFAKTYVELRAQAAHDPRYRENFRKNEERLRTRLVEVIERGVADGRLNDVDPEGAAEYLLTLGQGLIFRRFTTEDVRVDSVQRELERYLGIDLSVTPEQE
jgi:AcrR family transcriptional regulator